METTKQRDLSNDPWLVNQLDKVKSPNYLGSFKVVSKLVREFAASIMIAKQMDHSEIELSAKRLAEILLGKDSNYSGPAWNSPGQIDAYVAEREGVESDKPEERVAGGLINMLVELYELNNEVVEKQALKEQWRDAVMDTMNRYTKLFMGIPEY